MVDSSNRVLIPMYHYVRDLQHSRYPLIKGLEVDLFRKQMVFFKENFNVIRMEHLIDVIKGNGSLPENAVLLTFDDGYIDNYTYVLPILEEFGFQGSFFIPGKTFTSHQLLDVNKIHYILASTDVRNLVGELKRLLDHYRGVEYDYPPTEELWSQYAVDEKYNKKETVFVKRILQTALPEALRSRISSNLFAKYVGVAEEQLAYELYMSLDQIRSLKRHGMYIGVHGYDHCWLGELTSEEMQKDISMGLDSISEFIDQKEWVMNYPYGSYNDETVKYARDNGAIIGLTIEENIADLSQNSSLLLPRLDCNDFPPMSFDYELFI